MLRVVGVADEPEEIGGGLFLDEAVGQIGRGGEKGRIIVEEVVGAVVLW